MDIFCYILIIPLINTLRIWLITVTNFIVFLFLLRETLFLIDIRLFIFPCLRFGQYIISETLKLSACYKGKWNFALLLPPSCPSCKCMMDQNVCFSPKRVCMFESCRDTRVGSLIHSFIWLNKSCMLRNWRHVLHERVIPTHFIHAKPRNIILVYNLAGQSLMEIRRSRKHFSKLNN